ncbi:MAG: hypothetical protein WA210_16205, partial [Burkholderiaceae bacterium]
EIAPARCRLPRGNGCGIRGRYKVHLFKLGVLSAPPDARRIGLGRLPLWRAPFHGDLLFAGYPAAPNETRRVNVAPAGQSQYWNNAPPRTPEMPCWQGVEKLRRHRWSAHLRHIKSSHLSTVLSHI